MIIGTIVAGDTSPKLGFIKSLLTVDLNKYPFILHEGSSIPDNRNAVFERARIMGDSLLFIDSDMVFTAQDIQRIEEHLKDKDIVTGLCVMSYKGHPASLFKKEDDSYKLMDVKDGVFEIDACGAAFLAISRNVIDNITDPFTPILHEKTGQYHGEDISFCIRAKKYGYKIWCDKDINIGHIKSDTKYYGDRTRTN